MNDEEIIEQAFEETMLAKWLSDAGDMDYLDKKTKDIEFEVRQALSIAIQKCMDKKKEQVALLKERLDTGSWTKNEIREEIEEIFPNCVECVNCGRTKDEHVSNGLCEDFDTEFVPDALVKELKGNPKK